MNTKKSQEFFKKAETIFPGGVNSPVRAWNGVGGDPLFIQQGKGSELIDADGNSFIDYACSFGPLILGHAHPSVIQKIKDTVENGTSFGAPKSAVFAAQARTLLLRKPPIGYCPLRFTS